MRTELWDPTVGVIPTSCTQFGPPCFTAYWLCLDLLPGGRGE